MKIAILVAALTAVAHAGVVVQQGPTQLIESGSSRVARTEDSLGNYAFGYDEVHTTGGSFRREQSSPNGQVTGSYGLRDADGRLRTVNYIADAAGFRAAITSNEPGVESKNTAGVLYNQGEVPPGPVIDETVVVAAAHPVPAGRLVAAPAAIAGPVVAAAPAHLTLSAPVVDDGRYGYQSGHFSSHSSNLLFDPRLHQQQVVQQAPLVQQVAQHAVPLHFASQVAHAAPLAAQATAPLNHGPIFGAAGISAPVLAAPGIDALGRLTNAAVPTVNNNPLTDGPFAQFSRPAISTPAALATGPLAAPLNPWQTTPLASPQVAASGQLLSGPLPQGPLAPGLAVSSGHLVSQGQFFAHQTPSFFAPQVAHQQVLAAPAPVAAVANHGHLVQQQPLFQAPHLLQQQVLLQQQRLHAPTVQVAGPAIAGIAYQTQINHAFAPAAHGQVLAAPAHLGQVRL